MTLDEFLTRLRETPRGWRVDENGWIRNGSGCCPLEAVGSQPPAGWAFAGVALGMERNLVADIAHAADGLAGPLRSRLAEECGLSEG